jgi:hypothetical protein
MNKFYAITGAALLIAGSTAVAMASISTPEIDPSTAGSAIALVSGMLLLARARRK